LASLLLYLITKNELYKETVYETLKFIEREMLDVSGGFYSAIDADSLNKKNELEEGAYYVWTKTELKEILKNDFELFSAYYNINSYGFWEDNNYHLIKNSSDENFSKNHNLSIQELKNRVINWKSILLNQREKRSHPRLDDKILTSWNGIMLKGFIDAFRVFNDSQFLEIALKNARFIELNMIKEDGTLFRNYKNGQKTINGYLEDYGTVIDSFVSLYEVTLDEKWLMLSKNLTDTCFDYYYNSTTSMFYFTSNSDLELITRKTETEDSVMPSSNSIMAKNLFKLSHYFDNKYYLFTDNSLFISLLLYC